jgi:hypothetical protein
VLRHFYRQWRIHILFPDHDTIVIISVSEHTNHENPHAMLAEIFPGLSTKGRRRSSKPPCCEQSEYPPVMAEELRTSLTALFGF